MLKTIIVLPDGTELSSGTGTENAIKSITITESVNDSQELTIGSACVNVVSATIITPGGGLSITAGDELTVYREDDSGQRHKFGLFTTEKPTQPTANTMGITAFDRMTRLDRDLSKWLAGLTGWPYTVNDFARMVCDQCGLVLVNDTLPDGAYKIQKFSTDKLTGRTLVKWIGQIAGSFARITADGALEFAWYAPREGVSIGPRYIPGAELTAEYEEEDLCLSAEYLETREAEGDLSVSSGAVVASCVDGELRMTIASANVQYYYFQNSLSHEDYAVAPVEKVQLQQTDADVGSVFPQDLYDDVNTYKVTGNYLLSATNAAALEPVVAYLYERLHTVSYTPCKVVIPANMHIFAGDIVNIIDGSGKVRTMYVMKKTQSGQRDTLECTGSPTRDSSMAVNNQTFDSLAGRVFNLRMSVEGLKVENRDVSGKIASIAVDVDGISTEVQRQQADLDSTKTQLTQIRQDAEGVAVQVKDIRDNGVSRVETTTGYTFGADGLKIRKSGEEMENKLDNTGMYVTRSGETILQANNAGVVATDVTVRSYLVVGGHARFEDYNDGTDPQRTACFFV